MLQCAPYIKSICHHLWMTEGRNPLQKPLNMKNTEVNEEFNFFEVSVFGQQVSNTSLCVVDDLIVNVNPDLYGAIRNIQPESPDVIMPVKRLQCTRSTTFFLDEEILVGKRENGQESKENTNKIEDLNNNQR